MGEGKIPLSQLNLDKLTEQVVNLEEAGQVQEILGKIVLGLRLVPKLSAADQVGEMSSAGSLVNLTNTSTGMHNAFRAWFRHTASP